MSFAERRVINMNNKKRVVGRILSVVLIVGLMIASTGFCQDEFSAEYHCENTGGVVSDDIQAKLVAGDTVHLGRCK